jgi:hypothetical protein
MNTLFGNVVNFKKGTISKVDIVEIAHALALTNRYGGHTQVPYSVAQHSLIVSQLVPDAYALEGLLHDAAEAYIGDIVGPFKHLYPELHVLEHLFMEQIVAEFKLKRSQDTWDLVEEIDRRVLLTEMEQELIHKHELKPKWAAEYAPIENLIIKPFETWQEAEEKFLARFEELTAIRKLESMGWE